MGARAPPHQLDLAVEQRLEYVGGGPASRIRQRDPFARIALRGRGALLGIPALPLASTAVLAALLAPREAVALCRPEAGRTTYKR